MEHYGLQTAAGHLTVPAESKEPYAAEQLAQLHADAEQFGAAVPYLGAGVEGRPVLVWGGGTVGLFCALFARQGGASEIVVVDPSPWRQDLARRMGFDAMGEDEAWRHAKSRWHHEAGGALRPLDELRQTYLLATQP